MRVNPTDASLALILHSLDHAVLPEEIPQGARSQLEFVRMTVNDLLKRQGPSTSLVQSLIGEGESIQRALLEILDGSIAAVSDKQQHLADASFDTLAQHHGDLTEQISDLCLRLRTEKPNDPRTPAALRAASEWELKYYVGLQSVQSRPFGDDPKSPPVPLPPLSKKFLEDFLVSKQGRLEVTSLSRNPGGYGKQTYFATIKHEDGSIEELVVRKSDAKPFLTFKQFRLDQEFDLLLALRKAGYLSPTPIDLALDLPGIDGSFFTMKRLKGKMVSAFLDGLSGKIDDTIWMQLAEWLAKLHSIPLENFTDYITKYNEEAVLKGTVRDWYRKTIKDWHDYAEEIELLKSPSIHWLFHWLERNIPDDLQRPVLIHGDFNIHNMLADNNVITGILDWETSTFGAPEQDLAWIQPHVSKHIDWEVFLSHYRKSGGREIKSSQLPFCLGMMVMQLQVGMSHANYNLQSGDNRDIRFIMCEHGFTPYLIMTGLGCTAGPMNGEAILELPSEQKFASKVNGACSETTKLLDAAVNDLKPNGSAANSSTANGTLANGIRKSTNTGNLKFNPGDKITTHGGRELEIRGDETQMRQKPGPEPNWQDSVVLVWWDEKTSTGGFHRIGHEPNVEDGPKILSWNNLFSPQGIYVRATYNPMRESDKLSHGGFGSGDDTAQYQFIDGEHIWSITDTDISAHLSLVDTGPNVDCFPKKGTLSSDFAPAHFDIPGTVSGWMKVKGHEYQIQGLGLRDHGWGTRDWNALLSHRWVAGTFGKELGFLAVAFHTVDDQMISFGWVIRNGEITFAKKVDILAYFEIDSVTNRGGHVQLDLTTGETLNIEATPLAKAVVSYSRNIYCVDRMCSISCADLRGICDFETTSNFQEGKRNNASKFVAGVIGNGFHDN